MTSKNVLLFGALLFLLLVTSCVAYFIDRFNPQINTVAYMQQEERKTTDTNLSVLRETEFEEMPIDTMQSIETTIAERNDSLTTLRPVTPPKAVPPEENSTVIHEKTVPEATIATVAKKVTIPSKIKKQKPVKRAEARHPVQKKKVLIEPVLLTKELSVPKNGRLYRRDKTLLQHIAQKAKKNRELFVVLRSSHITPRKRTYLQKIKSYLMQKGLYADQIKIAVKQDRGSSKILFSDHQKESIELSLLERI